MSRASDAGRPAFLVDAMLGDVARWLRILGEDAVWVPPEWPDEALIRHAARDGRVVVTRDQQLAERAPKAGLRAVLVPQDAPAEVLFVLYQSLGLVPEADRLATRCAACNGSLVAVDGAEAARRANAGGKEPPLAQVRKRHERFWSCVACGQAYWRGTHWETITALRDVLVARLEG